MDLIRKIFVGVTIGLIVIGVPAFTAWLFRIENIGTQMLEQNKAALLRFEFHEKVQTDHEARIRTLENK
jgi:hypothetical protein